MVLAAALTFTSCVDWQKRQEQQETKPVEKRVEVTYSIDCTQDVIDALDLVITYKDKGGINSVDTLRDTHWTKTVVHDMVPAKAGLIWSVTPKPGSSINKDTIDLDAKYAMEYNGRMITRCAYLFYYPNFPVSRLETLCDLINLQRASSLSKDDLYECNIIMPYGENENRPIDAEDQELKIGYCNWEDDQ